MPLFFISPSIFSYHTAYMKKKIIGITKLHILLFAYLDIYCYLYTPRLSRFHRSAGLDDTPSSGRNSPVLSASPSTSKFVFEPSPNLAYPNPRCPPYPTPNTIKPLVQLRQPLLQNLIGECANVSQVFIYDIGA